MNVFTVVETGYINRRTLFLNLSDAISFENDRKLEICKSGMLEEEKLCRRNFMPTVIESQVDRRWREIWYPIDERIRIVVESVIE